MRVEGCYPYIWMHTVSCLGQEITEKYSLFCGKLLYWCVLLGLSYVIQKDLLWSKSKFQSEFIFSDEVYPKMRHPQFFRWPVLSEASVNFEASSYFQMRCTLRRDGPPVFEMTYPYVELGPLFFRWGVPSDKMELRFEIHVRSDAPSVVVVVTVSCCYCLGIVIVHVQLQMNHINNNIAL